MASILIIDDEVNKIKSFESLLSEDHEVFGSVNSSEALIIIQEEKIDFV